MGPKLHQDSPQPDPAVESEELGKRVFRLLSTSKGDTVKVVEKTWVALE